MNLDLLPGAYAVCRLAPDDAVPAWAAGARPVVAITRTRDELSVVCAAALVPPEVRQEAGWRMLKVEGPLDFGLTGILAAILEPLARARISIFALSTFNTDYILVKADKVETAIAALAAAGHRVRLP